MFVAVLGEHTSSLTSCNGGIAFPVHVQLTERSLYIIMSKGIGVSGIISQPFLPTRYPKFLAPTRGLTSSPTHRARSC